MTISKLSDEIGENIYENVTGAIERSEEFKENHVELIEKLAETKEDIAEKKRQLAELSERYEKLFEEKNFGFRRLIKAFPTMKSVDNDEMLEKFRNHLNLRHNKNGEEEHKQHPTMDKQNEGI